MKQRDPYFDNARAILITLVVIGHFLEGRTDYAAGAIVTWIYAFHMPAFVAISGYLSRSYRSEPRQIRRLLTALLIPYLIFQLVQATIRAIVHHQPFSVDLWTPGWTLWFLLALFFWRISTPLINALRYPLLFAAVISCLAPLDPALDTTLTMGRALSFLPFFVLGLIARPHHLQFLRDFRFKIFGAAVLAGGLVLSFLTHEQFRVSIFHMSVSFADHDVTPIRGVLIRILVLITATTATAALLTIVPQRTHWWTGIGRNSLTVYLFHAILFYPVRESGLLDSFDSPWGTLVLLLTAIALTVVLSRNWFVRATSLLTDPPVGHLLVSDPQGSSGAGRDYRASSN